MVMIGRYVDNGATNYITNDKSVLQNFNEFSELHGITTADGKESKAVGKGTVQIEASVNGQWLKHTLSDVWYVPNMCKNLFSVLAAQDKQTKSKFVSSDTQCTLFNEVALHLSVGIETMVVWNLTVKQFAAS